MDKAPEIDKGSNSDTDQQIKEKPPVDPPDRDHVAVGGDELKEEKSFTTTSSSSSQDESSKKDNADGQGAGLQPGMSPKRLKLQRSTTVNTNSVIQKNPAVNIKKKAPNKRRQTIQISKAAFYMDQGNAYGNMYDQVHLANLVNQTAVRMGLDDVQNKLEKRPSNKRDRAKEMRQIENQALFNMFQLNFTKSNHTMSIKSPSSKGEHGMHKRHMIGLDLIADSEFPHLDKRSSEKSPRKHKCTGDSHSEDSFGTEGSDWFSEEDSEEIEEELNQKLNINKSQHNNSLLMSESSSVNNHEDILLLKSINTLLRCPLEKQIALKAFTQVDADYILQRSVTEELPIQIEKFQKCKLHSEELTEYMKDQIVQNEKDMKALMMSQGHQFKFIEIIKERNKIQNNQIIQFNDTQIKIQTWLNQVIQQNLGVIYLSDGQSVLYDTNSLGIFNYQHNSRIKIVRLMEHNRLDHLIFLLILIDSASQAIYDRSDEADTTTLNKTLNQVMLCSTLLFAVEAWLKIIAQGFIYHKNAYMRSVLNIFDLFVVITSFEIFFESYLQGISFKALRFLRVVRPLRAVKRMPSMRRIVSIIVNSVPDMFNTLIFFSFFLISISIMGVQLFGGMVHQRCRLKNEPDSPTSWPIDPEQKNKICEITKDQELDDDVLIKNSYKYCNPGTFCHQPRSQITDQNSPWQEETISYYAQSYDDFLKSLITVFQALTLEDWHGHMINLHNGGQVSMGTFFYLSIVFFGSYFLLNLILAVVMSSYIKYQDLFAANSAREKSASGKTEAGGASTDDQNVRLSAHDQVQKGIVLRQNRSKVSNGSAKDGKEKQRQEPKGDTFSMRTIYHVPQKLHHHASSKLFSQDKKITQIVPQERIVKEISSQSSSHSQRHSEKLSHISRPEAEKVQSNSSNRGPAPGTSRRQKTSARVASSIDIGDKSLRQVTDKDLLIKQIAKRDFDIQVHSKELGDTRLEMSQIPLQTIDAEQQHQATTNFINQATTEDLIPADQTNNEIQFESTDLVMQKSLTQLQKPQLKKPISPQMPDSSMRRSQSTLVTKYHSSEPQPISCFGKFKQKLRKFFKNEMNHMVVVSLTQLSIFVSFVAQIVLLDSRMSEEQEYVLEVLNQAVTWTMTLECAFMMSSKDISQLLECNIDRFLFAVNIVSIGESVLIFIYSPKDEDQVPVAVKIILEVIYSLRFLKLIRILFMWDELGKVFDILVDSLREILSFYFLMIVFIFMYSLLGMQLFAHKTHVNRDNEFVPTRFLANRRIDTNYTDDYKPSRLNFNNIFQAIISIHVCLIGDEWPVIMRDALRSYESHWYGLYFIPWILISQFFLLNYFLVIHIKHFQLQEEEKIGQRGFTTKIMQLKERNNHEHEAHVHGRRESVFSESTNWIRKSISRAFAQEHDEKKGQRLEAEAVQQPLSDHESFRTDSSDTINDENNKESKNSEMDSEEVHEEQVQKRGSKLSLHRQSSRYEGGQNQRQRKTASPFQLHSLSSSDQGDQKEQKRKKKSNPNTFAKKASSRSKVSKSKTKLAQSSSPKVRPKDRRPTIISSYYGSRDSYLNQHTEQKKPSNLGKEAVVKNSQNTKETVVENSWGSRSSYQIKNQQQIFKEHDNIVIEGKSLNLFPATSPVRIFFKQVLSKNGIFEMVVYALILTQAVLIPFDQPLNPKNLYDVGGTIYYMNIVQQIITCFFILELVIKVVVYGFVQNGPGSYLRIRWNVFDCFIVIISILGMIFKDQENNSLNFFKILRVIRVLRLLTRNEGLRLCVEGLLYSFPGILKAILVVAIYAIFAMIFFVSTLKGKFDECHLIDDLHIHQVDQRQIVTKFDCINYGGYWQENESINFNNIGNAMIACLSMITREGWVKFMLQAVDATGFGMQPKLNNNIIFYPIFIIYMIFFSIFLGNLFIEVVIATYEKQRKMLDRDFSLTEFQHDWINIQLLCYNSKPKTQIKAKSFAQEYALKIVEYKHFESFILIAIFANFLVLMFNDVSMQNQQSEIFYVLELIFLIIFAVEATIKIIAYQGIYFRSNWNLFDFILVTGSIVSQLYHNQTAGSTDQAESQTSSLQNLSVIRIFRVLRLFRLIKRANSMNNIFNSFLNTIPTFANVLLLIILTIYLFSVLGNSIFAEIKLTGTLNENLNFQTFGNSMFILLRMMTGEGWYQIMLDLSQQKQIEYDCQDHDFDYDLYKANGFQTYRCGNKTSATAFILVYVIIVSQIMLNLFIAVTLQGFNDVQRINQSWINNFQIQQYIEVWSASDASGSGYIHISELASLVRNLIKKKCELFPSNAKVLMYDTQKLQVFIEEMHLKLYRNFQYYNFHDILISLAQNYVKYRVTRKQNRNKEYTQIMNDYKVLFETERADIDDVIVKIDEVRATNKVQICRKLDQALNKFKRSVQGEIEMFNGNVYTSALIPIIVRLQTLYRQKMLQKKKRLQEQKKFAFRRQDTLKEEAINDVLSSSSLSVEKDQEKRDGQGTLNLKNPGLVPEPQVSQSLAKIRVNKSTKKKKDLRPIKTGSDGSNFEDSQEFREQSSKESPVRVKDVKEPKERFVLDKRELQKKKTIQSNRMADNCSSDDNSVELQLIELKGFKKMNILELEKFFQQLAKQQYESSQLKQQPKYSSSLSQGSRSMQAIHQSSQIPAGEVNADNIQRTSSYYDTPHLSSNPDGQLPPIVPSNRNNAGDQDDCQGIPRRPHQIRFSKQKKPQVPIRAAHSLDPTVDAQPSRGIAFRGGQQREEQVLMISSNTKRQARAKLVATSDIQQHPSSTRNAKIHRKLFNKDELDKMFSSTRTQEQQQTLFNNGQPVPGGRSQVRRPLPAAQRQPVTQESAESQDTREKEEAPTDGPSQIRFT